MSAEKPTKQYPEKKNLPITPTDDNKASIASIITALHLNLASDFDHLKSVKKLKIFAKNTLPLTFIISLINEVLPANNTSTSPRQLWATIKKSFSTPEKIKEKQRQTQRAQVVLTHAILQLSTLSIHFNHKNLLKKIESKPPLSQSAQGIFQSVVNEISEGITNYNINYRPQLNKMKSTLKELLLSINQLHTLVKERSSKAAPARPTKSTLNVDSTSSEDAIKMLLVMTEMMVDILNKAIQSISALETNNNYQHRMTKASLYLNGWFFKDICKVIFDNLNFNRYFTAAVTPSEPQKGQALLRQLKAIVTGPLSNRDDLFREILAARSPAKIRPAQHMLPTQRTHLSLTNNSSSATLSPSSQ